MIKSASSRAVFLSQKYKGYSKFIKGKKVQPAFQVYHLKKNSKMLAQIGSAGWNTEVQTLL
jgi:hypothetical protein